MRLVIRCLKVCFVTAILFLSCKKEENRKSCRQAASPSDGKDFPGLLLCNKTQAEAEMEFPQYLFYDASEPKFCWKLESNLNNNVRFTTNISQSIADRIYKPAGLTYNKVDCNSFCNWEVVEKSKSKITNNFSNTTVIVETFTSDTCNKLFVGRVITFRETSDSIITREFSKRF